MTETLTLISVALYESTLRQGALWLLYNVPGLPPILQGIHILAIVVLISGLGVAHAHQAGWSMGGMAARILVQRIWPMALSALGVLAVSGVPFILAQPDRYLFNVISQFKFFALTLALTASTMCLRYGASLAPPPQTPNPLAHPLPEPTSAQRQSLHRAAVYSRLLALLCLSLWTLVIFSGRWIAYVDYLFYE